MSNKSIRINKSGHVLIFRPDHPTSYKGGNWDGYVYEHRCVAEIQLGRSLLPEEEVHHLDGNPQNNKWDNLLVLTRAMHTKLHEWIGKGAPYSENIGMNGVNSEEANPSGLRCKTCSLTLSGTRLSFCSCACKNAYVRRNSKRPDKEVLIQDISTLSLVKVGKKYGVSDNAVRKWMGKYGIEGKPTLSQAGSTPPEGATTT